MIKNIKDLTAQVDKCVEKAIKLTKDAVYEVVLNKVLDYYEEPVFDGYDEPLNYERTGKLQESLTSSIIYDKNTIGFTVGWEDDYIEYRYPGWKNNMVVVNQVSIKQQVKKSLDILIQVDTEVTPLGAIIIIGMRFLKSWIQNMVEYLTYSSKIVKR